MFINHNPIFDTLKIEDHYSKKDGVDVKYVCTSAIHEYGANAADIFYRETPHPEFGNRYFGLYLDPESKVMITNADKIEDFSFEMIEVDGQWHYSQHRHDFRTVGDVSIDGGRAYTRLVGNINVPRTTMKIANGQFEKVTEDEDEQLLSR